MARDKIEKIVNYCLDDVFEAEDIEERRLYINGEVDSHLIDGIVYHILRYNKLDKDIPIEERSPILIFINSPGGDLISGLSVISAIRCSKTKVITVNTGQAASTALLVYISGHERYSFEYSEFLLHDGMLIAMDSTAKFKDRIVFETDQMEKIVKEFVVNQTKIDSKTYDDKYRTEWYFFAEEAQKNGVTNYILGKDCDIDAIL